MSGIAAVYYLDGRAAEPTLINAMLAAISCRGPDGINTYHDGPAALGHAMLRTTPESIGESQPLVDEQHGLALAFDGRVDNKDDLKSLLESAGMRLCVGTDAELVLRAYQCWGADAPARILGDFAFALWDRRKRQIFCARDFASVQPLFYYCGANVFMCASELHQLLLSPAVSRTPDERLIGTYLTGRVADPVATAYRDIRKLEGGCALLVRPEKVEKRTYFDVDPAKEIRYRTDAQYAEHFLSIFREAVRCRMRSIGGVAAELSGGLDSSLVVGAAEQLLRSAEPPPARFEAFSMDFENPRAHERNYIQDVASMWGLDPNWSPPFLAGFGDYQADTRRYQDFCSPPNFVMDTLMKLAIRHKGYRVVLTGQGGDQWFGGSMDCFADLLCAFRFVELAKLLRAEAADPTRVPSGQGVMTLLLRRAIWPLIPARARLPINLIRGIRQVPPFVNPDFARLERGRIAQTSGIPGLSFAQKSMYDVLKMGTSIQFAELNERKSAFAQQEARHPFYDRRLIEFAFAIPEEQRCRPGSKKYVMRQAGRELLPESVRYRRSKAEFSHILQHALHETIRALGGKSAFPRFEVVRRGWIESDRLLTFCREWTDRPGGNQQAIWSALAVEIWLRECA
jgi:asparagine synthase (glutamine-hydrolysing)